LDEFQKQTFKENDSESFAITRVQQYMTNKWIASGADVIYILPYIIL